jgi:hypothetical protein
MGWIIAGLVLALAFMVVLAVKLLALMARGIVLLGLLALRGLVALFR